MKNSLSKATDFQISTIWVLSSLFFIVASCVLYQALPEHAYIHHQDSQGYVQLADTLRTQGVHGFTQLPSVGLGYPALVACIAIFSEYLPCSFHAWIVLVQLCIVLLIFFFLQRLARKILGEYGNVIAGILCAVHVGFLTYAQCCLSEVLMAACYTLFLYYALEALQEMKSRYALQAGLVLGLSLWIKPAAWIYGWHVILVGLIAFWIMRSRHMQLLGWFTGGFCFLSGANLLFNYIYFGVIGFPPLMYTNLYYFLLPKMLAIRNGWSFEHALMLVHSWSPQQCFGQLIQLVQTHPITALSIWLQNMLKTLLGLFGANLALLAAGVEQASTSFFALPGSLCQRIIVYCCNEKVGSQWNLITWLEAGLMGVRLLVFIPGWYVLYRRLSLPALYLFFSFVGYLIFVTGADGCARLRMMSEPILLLVTAAGITFFLRDIRFRY